MDTPSAPEPVRTPAPTAAVKASIVNPLSKLAQIKHSEPPQSFSFALAHPPGISACDAEIIRWTAQYTAVNGRDFLSGLAQREQRNPQFDFLKPTHMLFSYFTAYVDAYAKIIQPPSEVVESVKRHCSEMAVLEDAVHRWEWNRVEQEKRRQESMDADQERSAIAAIDWHDFSIVETIEFGDNDLLELVDFQAMNPFANPATRAAGGGGRPASGAYEEDVDMDMDTDDAPPPPPPPLPPSGRPMDDEDMDSDIKVVTDYKPRLASGRTKVATMVDPISGKAVPESQISEHMRIQLMDPKWRTEQQRFISKQQETNYAEGGSIADSLRQFAKQRSDIFGTADEDDEALLDEQRKRQKRTEVGLSCCALRSVIC